ncbi:MAG: DUF6268 family outer membrane beta-barrel protein [Bacteroidota bacterium]
MQIVFKYGASILFLVFGFNGLAQDFELFKIETAYYPSQTIRESSVDGEVGFWEWGVQLAIPQPLKNDKTILIHRVGYVNLRADIRANLLNTDIEETEYYHSILYNLGIVQTLNANWKVILNVSPTLASDFKASLNSDDLLFQASVFAMNSKSEKLQYGFGLAYNTRFGRQLATPIGLLQYKTERIDLDMMLPNKLSILYNTHRPFFFGLEATLNGGLFNNNGEIEAVNITIDEAGYTRLTLGPILSYTVKDAFKFYATGGVAAGRRLEFINTAEEVLDRTPENGSFFRVGFSFNPSPKMKSKR